MGVLSVALLGMAVMVVTVIHGNQFSKELTTATILAQDKIEEMQLLKYKGISATNTTFQETYHSITNYPKYKRVTAIEVGTPVSGMKKVTVSVFWDSDQHFVRVKTYLAQ